MNRCSKLGFGLAQWCALGWAVFCGIISILIWAGFPALYSTFVKNMLVLGQRKDESLTYSAWALSNPPMDSRIKYYIFNVTNPDEITLYGAKPRIVEVGPYMVIESEHKKYHQFNASDTEYFYENYKRFVITDEGNCEICNWDEPVTIINSAGIAATADLYNPIYNTTNGMRLFFNIAITLLGEYPFVTHSPREILFDGYNDPILSAANSDLVNFLDNVFGRPVIPYPFPKMSLLGIFQGFNNSRDENYWIRTGKDDVNRVGEIITWADQTILPETWWTTDYARSIRGCDSGAVSHMHLQETDSLDFFVSFMCRSFSKVYKEDTIAHDIPAMTFTVPYADFDTTSELNRGFRLPNLEKINYFEAWPNCPNYNKSNCVNPYTVDCSSNANFCNDCCNKSYVDDTYLIPPGMFPLVCYPGRLQLSPMTLMFSPPHFAYSPQEVIDSFVGIEPDLSKHAPFIYNHEPYSGLATEIWFNVQMGVPIYPRPACPAFMHMPATVFPCFHQDLHVALIDETYHTMWLGFVFVPKFMDFLKYFLMMLCLFLVVLVSFCVLRRGRKQRFTSKQNGKVAEDPVPTGSAPDEHF